MDIYAAQKVFGRGRTFDRIDLARAARASRSTQCRARARARCSGPGFQVEPPSARGQQFESMLARLLDDGEHLQRCSRCSSGCSSSTTRSRSRSRSGGREIGILRALGATRGQIRTLFLVESAVAGLVGSLGGLGFGVAASRAASRATIGTLISDVYGVAQRADEVADRARPAAARRSAMGIVTSIVAALDSGAQRGARRSGAGAAEGQATRCCRRGENRAARDRRAASLRRGVGRAACRSARLAAAVLRGLSCWRCVAALLLSPLLALWLARALRPVLKWLRPVEGRARRRQPDPGAAPHVGHRRGADAVARAGRRPWRHGRGRATTRSSDWMDTALNPDLFVTPSQSI